MKIVYMGTPDFAVAPLEALLAAGHTVTAVVTQPDKPKGRSGKLQMSPVKECALQHDIPVLQPIKIKRAEEIERLRQYEAHFAVMNNETLSGKKWVRRGSLILCVSIILSTMFIKQHSMFDVLMAFIMGAVMYAAVYYYDVVGAYRFQTGKRQRKRARIG